MKLKMEKEKSLQGASRFAFILVIPQIYVYMQALLIIFSKTFVILWKKILTLFYPCFWNHIYFNDSCRSMLSFFKWNEISNMHALKILYMYENLIHEVLRVYGKLGQPTFLTDFFFISYPLKVLLSLFRGFWYMLKHKKFLIFTLIWMKSEFKNLMIQLFWVFFIISLLIVIRLAQ